MLKLRDSCAPTLIFAAPCIIPPFYTVLFAVRVQAQSILAVWRETGHPVRAASITFNNLRAATDAGGVSVLRVGKASP